MFNFIDFAAAIVFLVTMFDDSTQLVTVPRSSSDPIAELCRALVVLKRERYHIREVFKLNSDGHVEKVYWYGRSQYIEALNAPHHINGNVSYYTDYASSMRLKTPCKAGMAVQAKKQKQTKEKIAINPDSKKGE